MFNSWKFQSCFTCIITIQIDCPQCRIKKPKNENKAVKNTKDFIEKANNIHNFKYDYTRVHHVNPITEVP